MMLNGEGGAQITAHNHPATTDSGDPSSHDGKLGMATLQADGYTWEGSPKSFTTDNGNYGNQ